MDQPFSASSASAGTIFQVCFPGARAAVLDNLNRQREEGRLCDLSIQVQGHVFRAHRCVLAACSPYFHDQVLLKNVTTVSLPSVMDPVAFESVLSSAYTGQLSIVHDDIVNYVTVASFLQMWHIVDKCTELLKRPRPSAECTGAVDAANAGPHAHTAGTSSRQQSPSSTDCMYMEREVRRRDRKPDVTLPPLATWRRPQQFSRGWGRQQQRPSPAAQHLADSQIDDLPGGFGESEYSSSCEEGGWVSSQEKTSPFGHDAHSSRTHRDGGAPYSGEVLRQKVRVHQRGAAPLGLERLIHDRNRDGVESGDVLEKRRTERRAIEADEGIGDEVMMEKREGLEQTVHSGDFRPGTHHQSEDTSGQAPGKVGPAETKDKETEKGVPALNMTSLTGCETEDVVPVATTRTQWQTSPWSQPESRPQDEAEEEPYAKDEEDADCGRFTEEGTFSGDTYDEIEDGTGQVSQRPLLPPASPDDGEFATGAAPPEMNWQRPVTPTTSSHRLSSPSSAVPSFPPSSSSPPTPSSSSLSITGAAAYAGKVHFCHCGKAYTLKSMRDRHVKMQHLNLRPFGCPVCAKSFKMKHHLTKHLKTHGGLRPYECGVCGKKVIWRDSFLRHQARCERLASSSSSANDDAVSVVAAAAELGDGGGYSYGFDEGDAAFLTAGGGQVKVEEVDFPMDGLLGNVSGIVDELRTQSRSLDCHVFKKESFS